MDHIPFNGDIVERPWPSSGNSDRNSGGEDDGSFIPTPSSPFDACRDCDGNDDDDDGYSSDDSFVSGDYPIQYGPCHEDSLTCRMGLGSYCRTRGYYVVGVKQEEPEKEERFKQPWLQRNYKTSNSILENMPPEIQMEILLSMPDLQTLRSLIHASPIMHAQYRHTRRTRHLVLSTCLSRELDGYYYDAYANLKSRTTEFGNDMSQKRVRVYINSYKEWKNGPCPPPESLRPGQIRWMVAYYLSVIQPLQTRYSRWALRNLLLAHEELLSVGWNKAASEAFIAIRDRHLNGDLSRNEKIRICRSLYRYGTYQNLFGRNRRGYYADGTRQVDRPFSSNQVKALFQGLFNPWDIEGLAYIDIFVRETYQDIFHFVKLALCPRRRAGQKCDSWGSCGCATYNSSIEGQPMKTAVSRGLRMAARLFQITDFQELIPKLTRYLHPRRTIHDPLLWDCLPIHGPLGDSNLQDLEYYQTGPAPVNISHPYRWTLGSRPRLMKRWGLGMWDRNRRNELKVSELVKEKLDINGHQRFL